MISQHCQLPESSKLRLRISLPTGRRRARVRLDPRFQDSHLQSPHHITRGDLCALPAISKYHQLPALTSVPEDAQTVQFFETSGVVGQRHPQYSAHGGAGLRYILSAANFDTVYCVGDVDRLLR